VSEAGINLGHGQGPISLTAFGGDFQAAATAFLVVARSDPPDTDHAADR
jgi:hypothetical protein